MVGIVNAKRIWKLNHEFWKDKGLALKQEMIFASTGTKKKEDPPTKYVAAFAGSDIETNPPATNAAVEATLDPNQRLTWTKETALIAAARANRLPVCELWRRCRF
jgi:transaldolase